MEETRWAAFIGGVEMSLPFLAEGDHDEEVLCPQLEEVIGRVTGQERWRAFRDRQAFELAHHRRERVGRAFVE